MVYFRITSLGGTDEILYRKSLGNLSVHLFFFFIYRNIGCHENVI